MSTAETSRFSEFMEMKPDVQFGLQLARRMREKVMPVYGIKQSDVPINQISKDFNYALDVLAEEEVKRSFEEAWQSGMMYGYVTEDQGLVLPPNGRAELIWMIDPVDGSRPAQIGAEMATVTMVAVKGDNLNATFSDIEFGITHAIKEDRAFVGEKGKGVYEIIGGKPVRIERRKNVSNTLKDATLVYESYSMSSEITGLVIDPLLKELSFEIRYPCGSYSALTLVRGQNELHVDVRRRLLTDYPDLQIAYKPSSKSLFPLDIAAGWLMIKELGGKVTDGYGNLLDTVQLWKFDKDGSWSSENQISWIAAITPKLHAQAIEKLEEGFRNLSVKKS